MGRGPPRAAFAQTNAWEPRSPRDGLSAAVSLFLRRVQPPSGVRRLGERLACRLGEEVFVALGEDREDLVARLGGAIVHANSLCPL
jgi:hypothetical protein